MILILCFCKDSVRVLRALFTRPGWAGPSGSTFQMRKGRRKHYCKQKVIVLLAFYEFFINLICIENLIRGLYLENLNIVKYGNFERDKEKIKYLGNTLKSGEVFLELSIKRGEVGRSFYELNIFSKLKVFFPFQCERAEAEHQSCVVRLGELV